MTTLTIGLVLLACGCPSTPTGKGKLVGWVTDADSNPLPFVIVSADGKTVHTDGSGLFTFDEFSASEDIGVSFSLTGYADSVQLVRVTPNATATLNATLKRLSTGSTLNNASTGGSASNSGNTLTFPAGAINTGSSKSGTVKIQITPINLSIGVDVNCVPGELHATLSGGVTGVLDAYAIGNFTITIDGDPTTLQSGATATIRFKLASGSGLEAGDTVPLWYFNASTGAWVQQGTGTVVAGAGGVLYVDGTISHLGWWCCAVAETHPFTIKGHVYDATAQPVSGAIVVARGLDYHGVVHTMSDANGAYTIKALPNAHVRLSLVLPGAYYVCDTLDVTTGAEDAILENQNLSPDFHSCIHGHVTEEDGTTPVANTTVYSSAGGVAVTDNNGAFCMLAPGSTCVAVYVLGRPPVYVVTPATATCGGGDGAEVTISVFYPKNGDRLGFILSTLRTTDIPFLGEYKNFTSTALFYSGFKGDQFAPYDPDAPMDSCHVYTATSQASLDLSVYFGLLNQSLALNLVYDLDFGVSETLGLSDGEVPSITKIGALDAGSPGSLTNGTKNISMMRPLDYFYDFQGNGSLSDLGYATLETWMGGFFFQDNLVSQGFNNGETVTFAWPGGVDMGAFSAQGVIPGRLTLTAPTDLSTAFEDDALQNGLPVTWNTTGQSNYVSLILETIVIDSAFAPVRVGALVCKANDDGSYTIPASALAQMPQVTTKGSLQLNYLFARRHTATSATVPLTRGNGNGYVVLNVVTEPVVRWSVDAHILK